MFSRNTVADIRQELIRLLAEKQFVTDKSGVNMIEISNASFIADEPSIFGTVNHDYVLRELSWYYSQSLNVNDIAGGPPTIWKLVADKDGFINSNYGWCIFSEKNFNQYEKVLNELKTSPTSRRAIMIYTRPTMWYDYNVNGRSDFMCTNAVQYMIRNNKLQTIVQMRSNDVLFGYKNDYAWQRNIHEKLADDLNVDPGDIHWNVGSLHVYEKHFHLVK